MSIKHNNENTLTIQALLCINTYDLLKIFIL